jgi:hypothetical protein
MDTLTTWVAPLFSLFLLIVMITIFYHFTAGSATATNSRAALSMGTYSKVTQLAPLGCPVSDDTRLCDYYIASSAYSTFPSSYVFDYISDGVIPLVVKAGARLVELDIYADGNDKPVVGLKNEAIGFDYAKNTVTFESCCVSIANSAFNKVETSLSSDPFILSLMFHTNKTHTINACAEIIKTTLSKYTLGPDYAYHRKNLAVEPICNVAGKLIIVSGGNMKGTLIEELVNLSWSTSSLRRLTYMQASQPHDHDELINSNRQHITMVVPDPDPDLQNNNPTILFGYGCQWNLMNYGSLDGMMELYIGNFQQGSVILKPEHLRYKPKTIKSPVLPDPSVSFQPMSHTSPIYDNNPKTGDKSIIF